MDAAAATEGAVMIFENWAPLLRQWRVRNVLLAALLKTTPYTDRWASVAGTFAAGFRRRAIRRPSRKYATFADYFNRRAAAKESHRDVHR
jgi:hypothetical protein